MKTARMIVVFTVLLGLMMMGCYRSSPPEIKHFRPPARKIAKEITKPQVVADTQPAEPEPTPTPTPEPETETTTEATPTPAPTATPKAKEESKEPTIVGSWKVVEMTMNGQNNPQIASMDMIYTFAGDGTVTVDISGDQLPKPMTQKGTYTVSGNSMTFAIDGHDQSCTLSFESNDRAILEVDEQQVRIVLSRI